MPRLRTSAAVALIACATPALASDLYWTEFAQPPATGGISRTDVEALVRQPVIPSGLPSPYRIAIDPIGQKMYWTSTQGGGLRRANLDGTDLQTIVPGGGAPFLGVTIDVVGRQVLWSQGSQLRRANLDGTGIQTYAGLGASFIQDVALDPVNGKVYFSDATLSSPGRLRRMNIAGTGLETVVANVANGPVGLAIDSAHESIYFGTFAIGAPTGGVQRANLNGTNVQTIVSGIDVDSMALDPAGERLYWTTVNDTATQGAIWRSGLDGGDAQALPFTGFVPGGVTVIPEPTALFLVVLGAIGLRRRCPGSRRRCLVVAPAGRTNQATVSRFTPSSARDAAKRRAACYSPRARRATSAADSSGPNVIERFSSASHTLYPAGKSPS
jgi:hypothetical protein